MFLSRDQLLVDLHRALVACYPESAESMLREVEQRMPPDEATTARLASNRPEPRLLAREDLVEHLALALRSSFPDRADTLLDAVRSRIVFSLDDIDPDAYPSLVVVAPSSSRYFAMRFPLLHERVTLGRSTTCELFLWEDTISRRHLSLELGPDREVSVRDLDSTNGSFVNDQRVVTHSLRDGDLLRCGHLILRFVGPANH